MTTALFIPYYDDNPYQPELVRGLQAAGVDVRAGDHTRLLPILQAFLEHGRPDVLHLHWAHSLLISRYWPVTFLYCCRLLFELTITRLLGVDIVWTVHNRFHHESEHPNLAFEAVCRHVICRYASAIIVHGDAAQDEIISAYHLPDHVADRIRVVPHGNYVESYPNNTTQAEARSRLDLPLDSTVFLHIGNIRPYKNVGDLVDTFHAMPDSDLQLLIAGRPPRAEPARTHLESACTNDARINCALEFIPEDELQMYLRAADAVVLPFAEVLTSGSVVLALSFGRPVIAPRLGCIPGTVGDCDDLLYDPDAPDALERALRRAMAADLDELGDRAAVRAANLDWETIGRRTADIYDQQLESAKRRIQSPPTATKQR